MNIFCGTGLELTFGRSFYIGKNNSHPLLFLVWCACAEVNATVVATQSSSLEPTFDPPQALFVNNVTATRVHSLLFSLVLSHLLVRFNMAGQWL